MLLLLSISFIIPYCLVAENVNTLLVPQSNFVATMNVSEISNSPVYKSLYKKFASRYKIAENGKKNFKKLFREYGYTKKDFKQLILSSKISNPGDRIIGFEPEKTKILTAIVLGKVINLNKIKSIIREFSEEYKQEVQVKTKTILRNIEALQVSDVKNTNRKWLITISPSGRTILFGNPDSVSKVLNNLRNNRKAGLADQMKKQMNISSRGAELNIFFTPPNNRKLLSNQNVASGKDSLFKNIIKGVEGVSVEAFIKEKAHINMLFYTNNLKTAKSIHKKFNKYLPMIKFQLLKRYSNSKQNISPFIKSIELNIFKKEDVVYLKGVIQQKTIDAFVSSYNKKEIKNKKEALTK